MITISRQNLFGLIKKYNLQNEVKNQYGRPYTNVPNYELKNIINEYEQKNIFKCEEVNKKKNSNSEEKIDKLISLLAKKHILLNSEIQEIYNK
jgi:hypothetical protein